MWWQILTEDSNYLLLWRICVCVCTHKRATSIGNIKCFESTSARMNGISFTVAVPRWLPCWIFESLANGKLCRRAQWNSATAQLAAGGPQEIKIKSTLSFHNFASDPRFYARHTFGMECTSIAASWQQMTKQKPSFSNAFNGSHVSLTNVDNFI